MGKVMRHTLGASLNIRHNLSSSKGPKPLQLKLLTTYIPKTSAFRSEERFSRNAETDLVCRLLLEKKKRSAVFACSLADAISARVASAPMSSHHTSTSQRGGQWTVAAPAG